MIENIRHYKENLVTKTLKWDILHLLCGIFVLLGNSVLHYVERSKSSKHPMPSKPLERQANKGPPPTSNKLQHSALSSK